MKPDKLYFRRAVASELNKDQEIHGYIVRNIVKEFTLSLIDKVSDGKEYLISLSPPTTENEVMFDNVVYRSSAIIMPIIRCKDCLYWNELTHGCKRNPSVYSWDEDDFCNKAEMGNKHTDVI